MHAFLLQRTRERNSGNPAALVPPGLGLSALIDHVPNHCRACKHEALVRFQRCVSFVPWRVVACLD